MAQSTATAKPLCGLLLYCQEIIPPASLLAVDVTSLIGKLCEAAKQTITAPS